MNISDAFQSMTTEFAAALEKKGLILEGMMVNGRPLSDDGQEFIDRFTEGASESTALLSEALESEKVELFIQASFKVGEFTLSDKVLAPEEAKAKREFELIAPLEHEIALQAMLEEMREEEE